MILVEMIKYFLYNNLISAKQIYFNLLLFLSGSGVVLSVCYGGVYVFTSKVLEPILDVSIFFLFINKLSVFNYLELVVLVFTLIFIGIFSISFNAIISCFKLLTNKAKFSKKILLSIVNINKLVMFSSLILFLIYFILFLVNTL